MSLPNINPEGLFDVKGKTAIVVGATGSFGQVVCATLGRAGAKLVITAGSADKLSELGKALKSDGIQAVEVVRRPNTEQDCDAIVGVAKQAYGGIDILVVASGVNDVSPIQDMSPERFQNVMQANVDGAWLIARAAGREMIEQGRGGKVVFTSSARGKLGHPAGYSAYCTSKSAVDGMTKALGCEWGKYNISVGRLGEPEDLAGPLLFLCSAASNFHTGHIIYADGGYTAG